MKMKSKVAALAASLVMAGGAQAAVLTYEISHNFSSYQNNLDGTPAALPGGGLLSGTISFDSDTNAVLDATLTSYLPGPGGRTSIYDLDGTEPDDDVTTTASLTANVLTLNSQYDYFNVAGSAARRPAHGAKLTLDFGTGSLGDATLVAAASEAFYNYGWRFTVYGLARTTGYHGGQNGELTFSLADADGGPGDPVLETPLPAAFPLMFAGVAAFGAVSRRRRADNA
ncbi:VPLPA-CTERM sorting domain-containing protein [Hyphococcus luteus]|uniref:PEP-CTERM protein-sorting domain-containing protein n=1 Tax=Hyphococcus luteus TaxID=2058213 RepID=A0A2S7K5U9_9PROT|nr:VPLPA-CTERM sorting domain-containing protein [Marinicaulis flavus]PQA87872.1 hypothetical protein CW354_05840 [Marinicaulis flavus]